MTSEIKPIHLLLLEPSSNSAEALITILRNHGYPVRASQVVKEKDLQELLEKQSWDLCLTRSEIKGFTALRAIEMINEHGRDIPVVMITDKDDESELIAALQAGIKDVVPFKSEERIYLVAKRELDNLEQRKKRKIVEIQLTETEKRCSLLLDSSQDAIAYIHDGMHIYANQSYVELFSYEDSDELLCMPVMDMISSENHEEFRGFLRTYAKNPSNNTFACKGVGGDMEEFEVILTLTNASYDNEPCTQVLIKSTTDSAELEAKVRELSAQDVLTGLYNQNYFEEKLDERLSVSGQSGQVGHLLYIEPDQFESVEKEFGLSGSDDILRELAAFLQKHVPDGNMLARQGNESFMLLFEESVPEKAREMGETLCKKVADELFEVEGVTKRLTFSIGITAAGDSADNAKEVISNAHSACQRVKAAGGNGIKSFSKSVDVGNVEHAEMIEQIHEAIETGKLHMLYQPVVKLHGDERPLYQSLMRMQSPNGDVVPPNQLFPIAEIGGLAAKLDRWVIMQSVKTLLNSKVKATLFIHLSATALTDEGLIKYINDLLKSRKMQPSSFVFQVKADDALTYLKRVILLSNALRKVEIGLAITHFKHTEEHVGLLEQLLPAFVFSDGELTTAIANGGDTVEEINQICQEAHRRDIASVIPKVEDAASMAALWPLGVHYIQGFYLQAPGPALNYDFSSSEF